MVQLECAYGAAFKMNHGIIQSRRRSPRSVTVICAAVIGAALAISTHNAVAGTGWNVTSLKLLGVRAGFIRLEDSDLFLTSSIASNTPPGYWYDLGTNPANPQMVSSNLPGGWDVAVTDKYAYLCDYTSYLTVYDIHGLHWSYRTNIWTPSLTENIIIRGDNAYIADHTAGLVVVNVSNPAAPVRVANFNPAIDCDALALWQNTAILYGHWQSRLVMVNIQSATNPFQLAIYQHPTNTFMQGELAVENGYAYCTATEGLVIVNITNVYNPFLVKVVPLTGLNDVIVKDRYAFAACTGDGVHIFDMSVPAAPVEIAFYRRRAAQLEVKRSTGPDAQYFIYAVSPSEQAEVLLFRPGATTSYVANATAPALQHVPNSNDVTIITNVLNGTGELTKLGAGVLRITGAIAPGASPGTLTINESAGTVELGVSGDLVQLSIENGDMLSNINMHAAVNLSNIVVKFLNATGGATNWFLYSDSGFVGAFAGVDFGAYTNFSYLVADGNMRGAVVVPEPAAVALMAALAGNVLLRRKLPAGGVRCSRVGTVSSVST